MGTPWTCPEEAVVDCAHAFSEQGLAIGLSLSDLFPEIRAHGDGPTDYPVIETTPGGVEMDSLLSGLDLGLEIAGHPLSNAVIGTDIWKDLETDTVLLGLETEISDRGRRTVFQVGPRFSWRPAFFTSAFIHTSCLCLMAFLPVTPVAGTTGGVGNVVMMRVVAHEDVIPQDESPSSIDSAASAPSKAARDEHREQPPPEPPKTQPDIQETGPGPAKSVMKEEPQPTNREREQERLEREQSKKPEDTHDGDAAQDSLASAPSAASAERQFIPAAGQEGNAFDAMVLSTIREAIFFPKAAFKQRLHGEVTVAFAIVKNGSLTDLRIIKPSESAILNEAAVKILEKAAKKFPPIPDTIYRERLEYVVPILFKKKRG